MICEPLLVDQKKKCDFGFLPEQTRIVAIPQSHRSQGRALALKGALVFAQLRDVLTAEDSTIMAEENENRRPLFPESSKTMVVPIAIWQHDGGKNFT